MTSPAIPIEWRVVIDTSVLVAALRSNRGAAAELIRLVISRKSSVLMDYKLIREYRDVALRSRHILASDKTAEETEAIITALEAVATPVMVHVQHRPMSRDADDNMVLDVAINGHANVLSTNNVKDFTPQDRRFGIRVLTPREFLMEFREEHSRHASGSEEEHPQ
jgi:putative PIN family toxin of toxin-antitoxin system